MKYSDHDKILWSKSGEMKKTAFTVVDLLWDKNFSSEAEDACSENVEEEGFSTKIDLVDLRSQY